MISKTDINRPGNVFFAGYGHHHSTEYDENGRSDGIRTHEPFTPSGDNAGIGVGFLRVTAALNRYNLL
jgi:hypothetical protein